jgi:translocation and assembly module TamB
MSQPVKRLLRRLLALVLLVVVPIALLGWLLLSEPGLRWTLSRAVAFGGGSLETTELHGRVLGSITAKSLRYASASVNIEADELQLDWQPRRLLRSQIGIAGLHLSRLAITLNDSADEETAAHGEQTLPSLNLPLALLLDQTTIDHFSLSLPALDAPFELVGVQLVAGWAGSTISVDGLQALLPDYGPLDVRARFSFESQHLHFEPSEIRGPGTLRFQGRLAFFDTAANDLRLSWENLRYPLQGEALALSPQGEANLQGPWSALQFKTSFALAPKARVQAQGNWSAEALNAQVQWRDLEIQLPATKPATAPTLFSRDGELKVTGKPAAYRYELKAALLARQAETRVDGKVAARGNGDLEGLVLEALQVDALRGELSGSGRLRWSPAVQLELNTQARGLDPGVLWPDWPGTLTGVVELTAEQDKNDWRARFDARLDQSVLRGYPLSLDAQGDYVATGREAQLWLTRAQLQSGGTRLQATGAVLPPFDFSATLDSPDLGALWPGLGGAAKLDLQLRGPLREPQVVARGEAKLLRYGEYTIGSAQLDANLDRRLPSRIELSASQLQLGQRIEKLEFSAAGTAAQHEATLSAQTVEASATLKLAGALDIDALSWSGALRSGRIAPADAAAWQLEDPAVLLLSRKRQNLEAACFRSDAGRACVHGTRDVAPDTANTHVAFRLEQLPLAYFRNWLPDDWDVSGTLSGTGAVALEQDLLTSARADLTTSAGQIAIGGKNQLDFLPSTLTLVEEAAGLDAKLELQLAQGRVIGEGQLAPGDLIAQRALQATLHLDLPRLDWLTLLSPEIAAASGRLSGELIASGSLAQPRLQGGIQLQEARVQLATPGIELTGMQLEFSSAADGAVLLSAQASSGGGQLQFTGSAPSLAPEAPWQLELNGENFQAFNTRDARIWVSPKLQLRSADRVATLSGEIRVPRADITPRNLDDGGSAPSSDQIIVGEAASAWDLKLNTEVRIILGEAVRFEGFGLKTRLEGEITARDEQGRPTTARGELRLLEGRYKAYGQDLTVESGRLIFNGPVIDPAIDLKATRKPREDIEVGVRVRGTLDEPEFSVYSVPTMPREQQLSWLVLGRPLEETGGSSENRAMLANAALSLGLSGSDFLAAKLGAKVGLDEVTIGARPGDPTDQARFTIGKYLSPKLFVSYGVGLFQPGHYFRLLYDLGHGFKLQTESGVTSGGDLLYTIER